MTRFDTIKAARTLAGRCIWLICLLVLPLTAPASTVPTPTLNAAHQASKLERLRPLVRKQGSARLIVVMNDADEAEKDRPRGSRKDRRLRKTMRQRRAAIAARQERVLHRINRQGSDDRVRRFRHLPLMALEVDESELEALAASADVIAIEEDRILRTTLGVSAVNIGAMQTWSTGYSGAGQFIAILDTGVDTAHDFFRGKDIIEACFSTRSTGDGVYSVCPNRLPEDLSSGSGRACTLAGCDHGTHVAGIALGNAGGGFSGIAKDADLIAIQVFSEVNNAEMCGGSSSCILAFSSALFAALDHVYELRVSQGLDIAAVNLSLGGGLYASTQECDFNGSVPSAFYTAVRNLADVGINTVVAAGNSSSATKLAWPGCHSNVVNVGAAYDDDAIAGFSNRASWLSLLAPGVGIQSSIAGGGYGSKSGTSMAAPHVAGALAVLRGKASDLGFSDPEAGAIQASLTNSGEPVFDSANQFTLPRLQIDAAAAAIDASRPLPVDIVLDGHYDGVTVNGSFGSIDDQTGYRGKSLIAKSAGRDTFRFVPDLPHPGMYEVSVFWPRNTAGSSAAEITLVHEAGTEALVVNQINDGGTWVSLGTFPLRTDGSSMLEFSDSGPTTLLVDAVRFQSVTTDEAPTLEITTAALAGGTVGVPYEATISATGGIAPYSWRVSSGDLPDGVSLDFRTGALTGTPAFASDYVFTVQVVDAVSNVATKAFTIRAKDATEPGGGDAGIPLLNDDFGDGNFAGWSIVDEGWANGPSVWSAATGELVQSTNITDRTGSTPGDLAKFGSYARYDAGGAWTDYRARLQIRSTDDDGIGLMFRVQDADNYYRFSWDAQRRYRRLVKVVDGRFTLLAEQPVAYVVGRNYQLEVAAQGSALSVSIDGSPVFTVTDGAIPAGTIALYNWANAGSYYDNVVVEALATASNSAPSITGIGATPLALPDNATTRLSVSATDPDNGPAALSYTWTASPAGSFDRPDSAAPVFTPPDVAGPTDIVLSVTVSDGAASASRSITVNVHDASTPTALLSDTFGDGNFAGWSIVDEGWANGPSVWSAATGELVQSTNITDRTGSTPGDLAKFGSYARYDAGGAWTDYRARLQIRSTDDDGIGLMFRVQDADNYYRFSWDAQRRYRRLVKVVDGRFTLLAEQPVAYVVGRNYQLEVAAQGSALSVSIDGSPVFTVTDGAIPAGTIALYNWANAGSYYDNVLVQSH